MANLPTLVFIPGSWHKPICYDKIIKLLREKHKLRCVAITLPSTTGNPDATFKDDIDAARAAISSETSRGRDVVVIAHSFGGMIGNSAVKGFTRPKDTPASSAAPTSGSNSAQQVEQSQSPPTTGYVVGIILIASGYTMTGVAFMDPAFGHPPPAWRVNKETGFADIVTPPRELFYHDLPDDEANYWVSQLTPQSLKTLFEGREYAYAGWLDVPSWYIGTIEDRGLPVVLQRVQLAMAREMGGKIVHREMQTSHSPFLSQPEQTVGLIVDAVEAFTGETVAKEPAGVRNEVALPEIRVLQPLTWFKYGLPYFFGRIIGRSILIVGWVRRLFRSA